MLFPHTVYTLTNELIQQVICYSAVIKCLFCYHWLSSQVLVSVLSCLHQVGDFVECK